MGVAAATAFEVPRMKPQQQTPVAVFKCGASRERAVTIDGVSVPVLYAGAQPTFPGWIR
jgi:hypothetical protein